MSAGRRDGSRKISTRGSTPVGAEDRLAQRHGRVAAEEVQWSSMMKDR